MVRLLAISVLATFAAGCAARQQADPLALRKAVASYEAGDYERSVQYATDALNAGVPPAQCHLVRAKAYERMGETKWAVADYEAARKANPGAVEPAVRQARLHQALGEADKADTLLEVVNGPMAETYTQRDRFLGLAVHAEVAMAQGNLSRALELFGNALAVVKSSTSLSGDPMVGMVYYNMSRILFERADYKQARSFYQRHLSIVRSEETGNSEDLYTLVVLHFLCGEITPAREVIARMPEDKRGAAEAVLNGEALSVRALYEKHAPKEEKK